MRQSSGSQPRPRWPGSSTRSTIIAALAVAGIVAHLALRWGTDGSTGARELPLYAVSRSRRCAAGPEPRAQARSARVRLRPAGRHLDRHRGAARRVPRRCARRADALRRRGARGATRVGRASSVLRRSARRMPLVAHRRADGRHRSTCRSTTIAVGDELVVFPHEICPVDGVVIEGHGVMDESYLTGEPYHDAEGARLGGALGRDQRRDAR